MSSFDTEPSRFEISNSLLQHLFDSREQSAESTAKDIPESEDQISIPSVSLVTQSLSKIPDMLDEP